MKVPDGIDHAARFRLVRETKLLRPLSRREHGQVEPAVADVECG